MSPSDVMHLVFNKSYFPKCSSRDERAAWLDMQSLRHTKKLINVSNSVPVTQTSN